MNKEFVEVKSFGEVFPKTTPNNRVPYEHQKNAMHNMDIINKTDNYSTLIVLPTGGGKTYTASGWLLKNAINKYGKENFERKIIDIAFDSDELNQLEYFYTNVFNSVDNDNWYNMIHGGGVDGLNKDNYKNVIRFLIMSFISFEPVNKNTQSVYLFI